MNSSPLAVDAPWIVLKFGGSSVSTVSRWQQIAELATLRRQEGARVLIVVSALAGITDALHALYKAKATERPSQARLIVERHQHLAAELGLDRPEALHTQLDALVALCSAASPSTPELTWRAELLAQGELLSSTLGAAFLHAKGLPVQWLDARLALLTTELPHHNERTRILSASVRAKPDPAWSEALAASGELFITQGFIARDAAGQTVLLGRGGSDTSAAYFGAQLAAERVEIWTDVAGIFSANPHQVPDARLLTQLDYEEAQEIVATGAKVLHPHCLSPLRRSRVPLRIHDTANPQLPGTLIGPTKTSTAPSVKGISARQGITLVSMESVGMWQEVGFLADVFAYFKRHGLSVDLVSSAETNVTVSLDPTENLLDSDAVARLADDLSTICRVKVIAPCAAITLVGRGMRGMLHRLAPLLAEFGEHHVHLITQSSNNLNLTFVVDEGLADELVPRLHSLLLRTGVLHANDPLCFGASWRSLYGQDQAAPSVPWWHAQRQRLLDLAEQGPCYVYHLPTVRARARALRRIATVNHWYYAIKANPQQRLLQVLAEEGFGLECVSPGELQRARGAAANAPRLFSANFASQDDFRLAIQEPDTLITLDGLHPLQCWGEYFRDRTIGLRIDLGRGLGHHEKVRTGGVFSKFGLALDDLDEFLQWARKINARISLLHAPLGSGVLDPHHWVRVYAELAGLAERIGTVSALDIGGGLGIPQYPDEAPLDLATLAEGLAEVQRVYPQYELWMEPGRFLVAEAGVLLARVTQIKSKKNLQYLGVETGMNSLIRPALYGAQHPIINLSRLHTEADTLYQVVGPICESGDILGKDCRLPRCQEGDVLLIANAGAYGAVMASQYNLRPPATETVIE